VPDLRKRVIRAGLETLYFTGTHRLARPLFAGLGAVLTFHRVLPPQDEPFRPQRGLEITPAFLDEVLTSLRAADIDIVPIDEAWRRLTGDPGERRFVAVTFDDGYRDTLEHAWPILKKHQVPTTIYVASAFAEGTGILWWEVLGQAVAAKSSVEAVIDGERRRFDCNTLAAKNTTYETIYRYLRSMPHQTEIDDAIGRFAVLNGVDTGAQCRALCMGWDELREMAADPLITIGCHTVSHPFLAKCDEETLRTELTASREAIERKLGMRPDHIAYPVGGPDAVGAREFAAAAVLGYKTGVTTRAGVIFPDHRDHLTALPRLSVNGEFQQLRFLDVLLSGTATAILNGFRRVAA
jgi:peptidoglycan/xylan/chitin deacetylase (PgdA/CDA1 family)